jgi:hypothetical protein
MLQSHSQNLLKHPKCVMLNDFKTVRYDELFCGLVESKKETTPSTGRGRIIQCLEDNLDEADFGTACRKELERNQLRQGEGKRALFSVSDAEGLCTSSNLRARDQLRRFFWFIQSACKLTYHCRCCQQAPEGSHKKSYPGFKTNKEPAIFKVASD